MQYVVFGNYFYNVKTCPKAQTAVDFWTVFDLKVQYRFSVSSREHSSEFVQ